MDTKAWNLFNKAMQMEIEAFSTFTTVIKKEWGYFLVNCDYRDRHDANHAMIIDLGDEANYETVISEIIAFYEKKELEPRINFYHPDKEHNFKKSLRKKCFVTESILNKDSEVKPIQIMIYRRNKPQLTQITPPDGATVIIANSVESDSWIAKDLNSVNLPEFALFKVANNKDYNYFVLYMDGDPVSILSLYTSKKNKLVRIDDVLTSKENRKRGYSSFLLNYSLNWAFKKGFDAYLYVYEQNAFRIYKNAGFETLTECYDTHWFLPSP